IRSRLTGSVRTAGLEVSTTRWTAMTETLSKLDRDALKRCVALTLAEPDEGRVEQITSILRERDWLDVATFCSYHRQIVSLKLLPWQDPPSVADADHDD